MYKIDLVIENADINQVDPFALFACSFFQYVVLELDDDVYIETFITQESISFDTIVKSSMVQTTYVSLAV